MKRLFLLLTLTGTMVSATAQETSHSRLFTPMITNSNRAIQPANAANLHPAKSITGTSGERSTSITVSGWYEYLDYMSSSVGASNIGTSYPYLWGDTSSLDAYSGGVYQHNTLVSYSSTFDPYFSGWANAAGTYSYSSASTIPASLGYTVDSIKIYGIYGTNAAKTSVVDTLVIGYLVGDGLPFDTLDHSDIFESWWTISGAPSLFTYYSVPSGDTFLYFETSRYDSATNTGAATTGGATYVQQEVYIRNGSGAGTNNYMGWYDTVDGGLNYKSIGLTTPVNVPAGNLIAFTVSFKTGDPAYDPAALTTDTVIVDQGTGIGYKYNMWRPSIGVYGSNAAPSFWAYDSSDHNGGGFKNLPNYENGWDNIYIPNFAWSDGVGAAATLQYPLMDYHLTYTDDLATPAVKNAINQVSAYPNPATGVITIAYSLANVADVSVSLTNVMGQVVGTQKAVGASKGSVEFSTSILPDGVYFYTLNANGYVNTGRVVVAH